MLPNWSCVLLSFVVATTCTTIIAGPLIGVTFDEGNLWDVDPQTGEYSNVRQSGVTGIIGLANAPDGDLFAVTTFASNYPNSLVKIDPASAIATVVGSEDSYNYFEGDIALDPTTGQILMLMALNTSFSGRYFLSIDTATGQATELASVEGILSDPSAMTFDAEGTLYVVDHLGGQQRLLTLDPTTGVIRTNKPLSHDFGAQSGLAIDLLTGVMYLATGHSGSFGGQDIYTVNPVTGFMTHLHGLPGKGFSGLVAGPHVVPETSSIAMATWGAIVISIYGIVRINPSRRSCGRCRRSRFAL
ncbi:MAG: hypothetical protein KF708_01450 [Pirellulales bacterium]|nr:hypothetical protein [Pirellulales bacterium]